MPRAKDSVTITAIAPKELKERLAKYAQLKRWSLSQAVVVLIEEGLERFENDSKPSKE